MPENVACGATFSFRTFVMMTSEREDDDMKKGLTEIVFIIDRSGSMAGLEDDTIGGYNTFLETQKEEGEAIISTVLFSGESEVIHDRIDVHKAEPMNRKQYRPSGCTALLDALGGAIHHIGNIHKYARDEDRPEKTIFVITTDGMENASRNYTYEKVRRMVERQKEKYGWEFMFLGANMDAIKAAGRFGIDEDRAVRFHSDHIGTELNYRVVGKAITKMRMESAPIGRSWKEEIEEDYERRKEE